jgi:hypothetical protein
VDCLWQKYKHKDIGFTNIEIPLGNKLNLLQRRQGDGFLTTDTVTNLKDGFFSMNGVIITVINPFGWHTVDN